MNYTQNHNYGDHLGEVPKWNIELIGNLVGLSGFNRRVLMKVPWAELHNMKNNK